MVCLWSGEMAFNKFARAAVVKPSITIPAWDEVRASAAVLGTAFDKREASRVVLQKYRPDRYLLSHCTIIASVDTDNGVGTLGKQMVEGFQIDRRYSDYLVTPETSKYVNNNNDCWERKLLMASFRSFVGGENYVEHLQIPEMSKGKIIDAAARDIGDSVYVDILVATDLKHKPLINAITSQELQTLSMGCQVGFTICTKCGNVAEDETQLCSHIRYMKGNSFIDSLGKTRKIAELCGHIMAEPGSVKFIEASWVANPAFTGAVLRNILTPEEIAAAGTRIQIAFAQGPRIADPSVMQRAAKLLSATTPKKGQGQFDLGGEGQQTPETPKKEEDPLDKAVGDLADVLREKAIEKVRGQIGDQEIPRETLRDNRDSTLFKEAFTKSPEWVALSKMVVAKVGNANAARKMILGLLLYKNGGWKSVKASSKFSGVDFLALSRLVDVLNRGPKIAGEARIYRTILAVGGLSVYGDTDSYLAACRRVMGRDLTASEQDALVAKGRLYDLGS